MSCWCLGILGDCVVARKLVVCHLISWAMKGIFKMLQGPITVNTVRSTFCSDNLDKSCSKIKGNGVRVINNVVDRQG